MSPSYRHPNYQPPPSASASHTTTQIPPWHTDHQSNTYHVPDPHHYNYHAQHESNRAYQAADDYTSYPADYYHHDAYASQWHDAYHYTQDRGHDYANWSSAPSAGPWSYNRQSYSHKGESRQQQQQTGYGYGPPHAPDEVWGVAASAVNSAHGGFAAPNKMREAGAVADANEWTGPSYYAHLPYHPTANSAYPPSSSTLCQQQRDYHSLQPASRYRPYSSARISNGSLASRPSPMSRLPQAIRAAPRPEYLEKATQESRQLTEQEAKDRKLLVVLDLNGTLVFRAKRGNGRALDSVRAVPRPFLACFLQYCLGIPSNHKQASIATTTRQIGAADRPHGSHFWQTASVASDNDGTAKQVAPAYEPRSNGKAEVVVWSSAQPVNVDSMVRASFDEPVRSQILRVWARDTLVPARFFQLKAESTKDLEIVWAELNAFANHQPSPGRLLAEARDQMDQERPDDAPMPPVAPVPTAPATMNGGKKYKKAPKKSKKALRKEKREQEAKEAKEQDESEIEALSVSAALEAARRAEELGPWGMENTVLVDDSVAKARLQPYNHLLIPEFGKQEAAMMRKFILQQLALAGPPQENTEGLGGLEYDSDLSIADESQSHPSAITAQNRDKAWKDGNEEEDEHGEEITGSTKSRKKLIAESQLDDVLLQTIGVLETLRYQSNVSAFIYSGGIKGYGEPKTPTMLNDEQKRETIQQTQTPEYWAQKGRETCAQLGIKLKAWLPSAAASATAALL